MVTYAHKKIIEAIAALDQVPGTAATYATWVRATHHLDYVRTNTPKNELIIYASGPYTFIHSIAVPAEAVTDANVEDLLSWSDRPLKSTASYVSGGGRETMWIERGRDNRGTTALNAGVDLVFGRSFEGWSGPERSYFEVNQEYTHLAGIHWRPERGAYCRFDENGDLADLVSITSHKSMAMLPLRSRGLLLRSIEHRYLRDLPYNEQLHWKSYNEEPKASISERAFINDFKGDYVTFQHPRAEMLSILQRWQARRVEWWTLRDEDLLHRANPPITASKDG